MAQLRDQIHAYQQLNPSLLAQHPHWQQSVNNTETALFNWLHDEIAEPLQLPNTLIELPSVLLAILLVNNTNRTDSSPLETWQHTPPWHSADSLTAALDGSDWQTWLNHEPILDDWLNDDWQAQHLAAHRLTIAEATLVFEQPELHTWLRDLQTGNVDKLARKLQTAWETAQQQAKRLGYRLNALASSDPQPNLFAKPKLSPSECRFALAAVILGDAHKVIQTAVSTWLNKQAPLDTTAPVSETLAAVKHRLTRAIGIHYPRYPTLANTVHDWSQARLPELLNSNAAPEDLWYLLERARIGLAGLKLQLPNDWQQQLGQLLWSGLRTTMDEIRSGHQPSDNEPWQPLQIWEYQINQWLLKPPTIDQCQQHLPPNHALVQPFLDPIQQRYRILWLSHDGLQLKDLPDGCAEQSHWSDSGSVTSQWTRHLTRWLAEYRQGRLSHFSPEWEQIMTSPPVQQFATTLSDWATDYQQITVIWPAAPKNLNIYP